MLKILLTAAVFFLCFDPLSAASRNSWECPDPECCLPSKGPSSCHAEADPCSGGCTRMCACGVQVTCGRVSRFEVVCYPGEALPGEIPCYTTDPSCDDFLVANNPCNEPVCTNFWLLGVLCDTACTGRGE